MKKITFHKVLALAFVMSLSFSLYSCKAKDSDIQKNVTEKLSTQQDMSNLSVDVKDGVVTLGGQCKDETCKATCDSLAKTVKGVKSVVNTFTVAAPAITAPVVINPDDVLTTAVKDAVKDFKGVNADVKDGVITLTGTIKRDRLQVLMQSLNSLKPKKINNQLTIQ